ncbi:MAG: hypothetical protein ACI4JM_10850, partial [Oscillospiraceae bacterium]
APAPPFRSFERPKALPLESASFFEKKLGKKHLISPLFSIISFCTYSTIWIKQNTEKWRRQLAAKSWAKPFAFVAWLNSNIFLPTQPLG